MDQHFASSLPGFTAEASLGKSVRGFRGQWSAREATSALQPASCDQACLDDCPDYCDGCGELPTPQQRNACFHHCVVLNRRCARACGC
jgi:hypothetical protein